MGSDCRIVKQSYVLWAIARSIILFIPIL